MTINFFYLLSQYPSSHKQQSTETILVIISKFFQQAISLSKNYGLWTHILYFTC